MPVRRLALIGLLLVSVPACSLFEPKPAEMLSAGASKLNAAKTVHFDGSGAFAIKDGMSMSFDFTFSGDANVADNSARMTMTMKILGQSLSIDTIQVGGRSYTKQLDGTWANSGTSTNGLPGLDPLSSRDLSGVAEVKEIDRPVVDGRQTRHFSYTVDPAKLKDVMTKSASSSNATVSDPKGSGEIWVRMDDQQIVRQMVKLSFTMNGASLGIPGATGDTTANFEISMDLRLSRHGDPLPDITAPPAGR